MKTSLDNLASLLSKSLAPIYWISGDEPFQLEQASQSIREAARQQGYSERQVFQVERVFAWEQLRHSADSLSLFAQSKLIEVRMPTGKPGNEGSQFLQEYAEAPAPDTILLIITGKLEAAATRTKWFKTVEQAGVFVPIWPLELRRLPQWLAQRLQVRGLRATPDAIKLLVERVEGNLLAADQEMEKLLLLYGPGQINMEQVQAAVADSARFDMFGLVDEALAGQADRVTRILYGLRAEGSEPLVILWALAREIRSLAQMARSHAAGDSLDRVMAAFYVWDKRKPLVRKTLQRVTPGRLENMLRECHRIDKLAKGHGAGRVWDELLELGLSLAGRPALSG